jgi:hypothetical protein
MAVLAQSSFAGAKVAAKRATKAGPVRVSSLRHPMCQAGNAAAQCIVQQCSSSANSPNLAPF